MSKDEPIVEDDERDEIAEFVKHEQITSVSVQIELRPDVAVEEQILWQKQDPDYPPEHYLCKIVRGTQELELYQTVGADYPDEDEEADNTDLYRDSRELLLSAEFLIESAALKANSIDQAQNLEEWVKNGYCQTTTPSETYQRFLDIRSRLLDFLGPDKYQHLIRIALEAEAEREDDEEEWS